LYIPPDVDALVMACLEKDPDKRPQDAQELFQIACRCCPDRSTWDQERAKAWWEHHLPELCGPLALPEQPPAAAERAVAVQ
jgi:hypothetical protein